MPVKYTIYILFLYLSCVLQAEETTWEPAALPLSFVTQSNLMPTPENLSIYDQNPGNLSKRERWQIKMHGLRYAILDPRIWAYRTIDQTVNKNLVSIRPFFLRASEDVGFKLQSLKLRFGFAEIGKHQIIQGPETSSSIFDIGLGGSFVTGVPGSSPVVDTSYILRLSGTPGVRSGLYFVIRDSYQLLQQAKKKILKTGKTYSLDLIVDNQKLVVMLNDKRFISYSGLDIATGLVSLQSDWNPLAISSLELSGFNLNTGTTNIYSGLLELPRRETND